MTSNQPTTPNPSVNGRVADIIQDMELFCDGDDWGETLEFMFSVCEILYSRGTVYLPDEWKFKAGVFGCFPDTEQYSVAMLIEEPDDVLLALGWQLRKRLLELKQQGKDY